VFVLELIAKNGDGKRSEFAWGRLGQKGIKPLDQVGFLHKSVLKSVGFRHFGVGDGLTRGPKAAKSL
jgi:hypothetical protein